MQRRLPSESEHLVELLTSWIAWRYARTPERLVLTSAPTSVPQVIEKIVPGAVWRLAWHEDRTAVLYGIAPHSDPTKYLVVRHDADRPREEGVFERLPDGTWLAVDGVVLQSQLLGFKTDHATSSRPRKRGRRRGGTRSGMKRSRP